MVEFRREVVLFLCFQEFQLKILSILKFGIPGLLRRGHPRGKNGGIPEGSCLFFVFSAISIENIKHLQNQTEADVCPGGPEKFFVGG